MIKNVYFAHNLFKIVFFVRIKQNVHNVINGFISLQITSYAYLIAHLIFIVNFLFFITLQLLNSFLFINIILKI